MQILRRMRLLTVLGVLALFTACSTTNVTESTEGAGTADGTDGMSDGDGVDTTQDVLFMVTVVTSESFFELIIPKIGSPSLSALTLPVLNCVAGDTPGTVECECPAGGTASTGFIDESILLAEEGACIGEGEIGTIIDMQFGSLYEDCAIEVCGHLVEINGSVSGEIAGELGCEEDPVVMSMATDEEVDCEDDAGLSISVDGEEVQNMVFSFESNPNGDQANGTFCTDEGLLPFDNFGDLLAALGEDLSCSDGGGDGGGEI